MCIRDSYHLVESYRQNGKVKHRTLLSLGKAGEDRMDELLAAISKHKEVLSILEMAKSIDVKDTYILGPLLVYGDLFLPWLPLGLCAVSYTHLDVYKRQH